MIMSKQVQVKKNEIPEGWSVDSADFVNRVFNIILSISFFKENQQIDLDLEELLK